MRAIALYKVVTKTVFTPVALHRCVNECDMLAFKRINTLVNDPCFV